MSKKPFLTAGAILILLGCCASLSNAQNTAAGLERFNRQLELLREQELRQAPRDVPAGQRVLFDYGAYFTLDYISVDDSNDNNHVLRQYTAYVYGRLNFDGAQELFLRGRMGYQDFNDGDSFSGRGDETIDGDLDRAYYRFDLARYNTVYRGQQTNGNLVAQVGRDLVYWGNGLTMAQVIDGGTLSLTRGPLTLDLIAGITPVRTVDIDASRPGFDFHTRRGFFGGMLSADAGQHRPYAYALWQQDYNEDETLIIAPTSTEFEYNSYYLAVGSTGNLTDRILYGAELVYEGGNTLSNSFQISPPFLVAVPQTQDRINAWAADVRLDYLFNDQRRSRVSAEVIAATGDSDRTLSTSSTFGGNKPGSRDNAFNAFGLLNTGLAFAPSVSNLLAGRVGFSTFPWNDRQTLRRLQVGGDVFVYSKMVDGGPIDEPSSTASFLGWEPDVFMNWQVVSDVTLSVRYGVFFPSGDAFADDKPRQFFSMGLTFAF